MVYTYFGSYLPNMAYAYGPKGSHTPSKSGIDFGPQGAPIHLLLGPIIYHIASWTLWGGGLPGSLRRGCTWAGLTVKVCRPLCMICLRTTLSFTWIPRDLEIAEMVAREL